MILRFNLIMRLKLIVISMICLLSLRVLGAEDLVKIRWKNGDVLPGRILPSQGSLIHFSSDIFSDNLVINLSELDVLEFGSKKENSGQDFLIISTMGDVIKANLVEANNKFFTFFSERLGQIQINRGAVYSLSRLNNFNVIFDGSQFSKWNFDESWMKGEGGHPFSNTNKSVLSSSLIIPDQFNLDLEINSTDSPRFLFAIGEGDRSAESDGALKLETWDNEIVLVQGQIFEPVTSIKDLQKSVRLRLSYNSVSRRLQIFNANGSLLVEVGDVQVPVQTQANISIRNRGKDLSIKRMVFYRGVKNVANEMIDTKKSRVLMSDGKIYYGRLFVANGKAFVEAYDMTRQDVDLSNVDRIFNPDMQLSDNAYTSELIYNDDVVIRGKLIQLNQNQVRLNTGFSAQPIDCLLVGVSYLKFNSNKSKASVVDDSRTGIKSGLQYDKMIYPEGQIRGEITFNSNGAPLAWNPDGSQSALKLTGLGVISVERNSNSVTKFLPFDKWEYPHLLHLRHGEIIPSIVLKYDDEIEFQMAFDKSVKKIDSSWVKAIEFNPLRALRSKITKGAKLIDQSSGWSYLANTELEIKEGLSDWANIDYHQIKFKFGLTGIGYGARGVLTEVPKGTTAVLMRHVFDLNEEFQTDTLYLQIDYDDGFAAYLNGKRIAESNAPQGKLDQYSIAKGSHEAGEWEQFNISEHTSLLRKGKNVLAIVGLNNNKTSSDLLINPILSTKPLASAKKNDRKEIRNNSKQPEEKSLNEASSVKLKRALMVSNSNRKKIPTHLLLTKNNDIGQGRLLSINKGAMRFEVAYEPIGVPIERLDKVVRVGDLDKVDGDILNYDFKSQTRLFLVDGSIIDLVVKQSDNKFLFGESNIYGELAIPISAIRKINLGGFESNAYESKFSEWVIGSAQESDVGYQSNSSLETASENQPVQARATPTPKSVIGEKVSELIIPENFSDKVKRIQKDVYRVGEVTVDAKLRVAAFPAKVNQVIGLIEYAIVTEQGKTHESFLSTKIKPGDLYVALLLLGASPKNNISVEISWQKDGRWVRKSIVDCIAQYPLEVASEVTDKETEKSFKLKSSWWKWTGSRVRSGGTLSADESGSILSLQPDMDALSLIDPMIDTSRFGSHVWSRQVPKKDSMVQIFVRLIESKKP